MSNQTFSDPVSDALTALPPVAPGESCNRRVRQRCHDLLTARRRRSEPARRRLRFADGVVAAAVAVYVVALVSEAARLLGAAAG